MIGKTIYYATFHGKWKDLRAVPILKRQGLLRLTKITDLMCHMGVHPHAHTLLQRHFFGTPGDPAEQDLDSEECGIQELEQLLVNTLTVEI